jgi:hypothetical protein
MGEGSGDNLSRVEAGTKASEKVRGGDWNGVEGDDDAAEDDDAADKDDDEDEKKAGGTSSSSLTTIEESAALEAERRKDEACRNSGGGLLHIVCARSAATKFLESGRVHTDATLSLKDGEQTGGRQAASWFC